jgi:hypothetical protein
MSPVVRRRLLGSSSLLLAGLVVLAACTDDGRPATSRDRRDRPRQSRVDSPENGPDPTVSPEPPETPDLLMASSFETPVCGRWTASERHGCEFGVQGGAETGPYDARTGEWAARIPRMTPSHQGVIADVPLEDGHAFIGVAHRIPAIPPGAIPANRGHIQIEQLSPTDGIVPGWPVEVRLFPDRRLGLALFGEREGVAMADYRVPVDEWFYVVVEVSNGVSARQRMWIYGPSGDLEATVTTRLNTLETGDGRRTAHKIGGNTSTLEPMYTYADDWYISNRNLGPARIDENGLPIDS